MGVPAFYKWLKTRYPKCILNALSKDDLEYLYDEFQGKNQDSNEIDLQEGDLEYTINQRIKENNPEIDNLYLDLNGIIHPCCHPVGKPQPKNEVEMFNNIFEYTDKVISIAKPQKLIYLAIDGVAPRAKMNQQRSRRFRTARDTEEKNEREAELRNKWEQKGVKFSDKANTGSNSEWDSNVITPGTEFMFRLSKAIEFYILERTQTHPDWKGVKSVYSDGSVPGEGEHKILDFIRSQRLQQGYDPNTKHCIYGADADLIMLGLSTHEPFFYILREKVQDINEMRCAKCGKMGHQETNCGSESSNKIQLSRAVEFQFIKIAVVREYLYLEFKELEKTLPFKFDFERIVDDFVFMCFLVGNDFLPHLPSLAIRDGSIDMIMVVYKHLLPSLGDYLSNNGQLDFSRIDIFFKDISQIEEPERRKQMNQTTNRRNYNRIQTQDSRNSEQDKTQETNSQNKNGEEKKDEAEEEKAMTLEELETKEISELQKMLNSDGLNEDEKNKVAAEKMKKVLKKMYDDENDKITGAYVDFVQLGVEGWKERYYTEKFKITKEEIPNFIQNIKQSYIEGLQWVFSYYYKGCVSWYWFYPYHYAPFASDLINSDRVKIQYFTILQTIRFELGEPASPFEQLLAVFPKQSAHAIPKCYQHLLSDPQSEIIDFYPTTFEFDLNGAPYTWMGVNLLPFIDRERLVVTMKKYEDQLTQSEKERNKILSAYLFFEIQKDSKSAINQFVQKQDFKQENLVLNPSFKRLDGIEGTIRGYSKAKGINEKLKAPFQELSIEDIESNKVVQVKYEHPKYEKHLMRLLEGVKLPRREVEDFEILQTDRRMFQGQRAIEMAGRILGIDVRQYSVYQGGYSNYGGYQNNHARGVQGVNQEGDRYNQHKRRRDEVDGNDQYQDQQQAKRFKPNNYQGSSQHYPNYDRQQQQNYYQKYPQQNMPNYNIHQYKQNQKDSYNQQPNQQNVSQLYNLVQRQQQTNPRQNYQQNQQQFNNRFQGFQDMEGDDKKKPQYSNTQQYMDEDNQAFHELLKKGNTPNKNNP